MEYAASIWDPVSKGDIRKLEMVQRKAARWARSCFSLAASVTKMLQNLKWDDLADWRKKNQTYSTLQNPQQKCGH